MEYLHHHVEKRVDPAQLLPGANSVIVAALSYHQPPPAEWNEPNHPHQPRGRVARYAWGEDYHEVLKEKLHRLVAQLRKSVWEPFEAKVCVDTTPLIEREFAVSAGIGWIGKNTMVLHRDVGSYFFLGEVVTTLALVCDEPTEDHCGSCTACLAACPTSAFPAAYEMDASRCISYLTIEHRSDIPLALQPAMGDWLFGCDVCQEICPFNRKARVTQEPRFAPRPPGPRPDLTDILSWTVNDYRRRLSSSAMKRATRDMLQRNARITTSNIANRGSDNSPVSVEDEASH